METKFWSIFFAFVGIASITGGTAHGFINYVGINFHYSARILTGIAVFSAQLAAFEIIKDSRLYTPLKGLAIIELLIMTASVILYQNFDAVRINSAFGLMIIVLPLQLYGYKMLKITGNGIIALGIISNIAPALIHAGRFSYNRWINFNDLSHVVMIGCFYITFLGAKKIASLRSDIL
jgi:hypothetical protein